MYMAARLGTDWRAWAARSALALVLTIAMVEATGEAYYAARYRGIEWVRWHLGFASLGYFIVVVVEFFARQLLARIKNG